MRKIAIALTLCAALTIPAIAAAQEAPGTGDSSSSQAPAPGSSESSAPSTPSTGSSESSAPAAPATGDSSSSAGSAPSTGDSQDSGGDGSAPSTGDSQNSGGTGSAPSTGGSQDSSGGSPSGGDGDNGGTTDGGDNDNPSSSGSRATGSVLISSGGSAPVVTAVAPIGSCPLITTFMKIGVQNDGAEVAKLQAFLRNNEGLNAAVTGVFDAQTETAVRAFQTKYLAEIMAPWGATQSSGIVYITTAKKINQLACARPLVLTTAELAIIDAYKARLTSDSDAGIDTGASTGDSNGLQLDVPSGSIQPGDIGSAGDDNENVAAAGGASIVERFWNFLKNLFR